MKKLNARGIAHFIVPAIVVVAVAAGGTFALVKSHAATAPCVHYQYGYGGSGTCVKYIQTWLNQTHNARLVLDGQYGTNTKNAVINFQRYTDIIGYTTFGPISADGYVGPQTWHKLCGEAYYANGDDTAATNTALALGCGTLYKF